MPNGIGQNIFKLKEKIRLVAQKFNIDHNKIELIAVSKFQDIEKIKEAYHSGLFHFGENYIQEWKEKNESISNSLPNLKWHIIGNIQSNKAKFINSNIYCLHSLDKISLAKEIEKKSLLESKIKVLIQLQVDKNDISKSGVTLEEAKKLCDFVANSKKMTLHGFMGIGPAQIELEKRRSLYFNFTNHAFQLWQNFTDIKENKPIISLGMSSDFEIAIECGSTMLRIGSAIFGERKAVSKNEYTK
jgi:PLP dependent protein